MLSAGGMTQLLALVFASLLGTLGTQARYADQGPILDDRHRAVRFFFQNRNELIDLVLLDARDEVKPASLAQLSRFVRCYRTDREKAIHERLVEIVARTAEAFGREQVDVVSGYRAAPYGAPHSKHFLGRAMDLHLPGVPAKKVAAWVWKNFRGVGVGLYPKQDFVHIDVRDVDVQWVDNASHGESGHARYIGRSASEPLPANAPRLSYDRARAPRPTVELAAMNARDAQIGIRGGY